MYSVGLTGPIASGKSTVAGLFAELGVNIINADQIAKQLTLPGQPALQAIIAHFGAEFLDANGQLQRRKLRDYIFKFPKERKWLENLLHPLIRETIAAKVQEPTQLYYMIEIPLLLDKKLYPYLNRTLLVLADPQTRIQRVIQRDQHSAAEVHMIIEAQAENDTYHTIADDIIMNTGGMEDLKKAVENLHKQYCLDSTS